MVRCGLEAANVRPRTGPRPLRFLQASTKGGPWHQNISAQARNKLVSLAYRLTVQTHSSEAPEVGGCKSNLLHLWPVELSWPQYFYASAVRTVT